MQVSQAMQVVYTFYPATEWLAHTSHSRQPSAIWVIRVRELDIYGLA